LLPLGHGRIDNSGRALESYRISMSALSGRIAFVVATKSLGAPSVKSFSL